MPTAMIIDADEDASGFIEQTLRACGVEPSVLADATEAVARAGAAAPALILLRVELPRVSGFVVCGRLRRDARTRRIPLILYGAALQGEPVEQHQALRSAADRYLTMPLEREALMTAVLELIEETDSVPTDAGPRETTARPRVAGRGPDKDARGVDGRSAPRRRRAALRRAHRWIGLALAVPFFLWSITGLLFHLKPGWSAAYDALSPATNAPLPDDTLPLARARAAVPGALSRAAQLSTALGPVYRLTMLEGSGNSRRALVDARTGATLSPLPAAQAEQLARAAIASSAHAARYGAVERRALHPDRVELFMDGPGRVVVTIDRHSGALSQRGADTARVDWLYRVHYGQWTGARWLDRVIPLLLLVGVTLLALAGLALSARGARARARPRDADRV